MFLSLDSFPTTLQISYSTVHKCRPFYRVVGNQKLVQISLSEYVPYTDDLSLLCFDAVLPS